MHIKLVELLDMAGDKDPIALVEVDGVLSWDWIDKTIPVTEAIYARPYQNDCRPFTIYQPY